MRRVQAQATRGMEYPTVTAVRTVEELLEQNFNPIDNQSPFDRGILYQPTVLDRPVDPETASITNLLRIIDRGGLRIAESDVVELREYLDVLIRPRATSGVQVTAHGQAASTGQVSPLWGSSTIPGRTLVAVVVTDIDADVGAEQGWIPIAGAASNDAIGVRIFYIPNASQREGDETFTTDGAEISARLYEVDGLISGPLDDVASGAEGSGTTVQSGSADPTTRYTWLLAALGNDDERTTQGGPTNGFNTLHTDTAWRGLIAGSGIRVQIVDKLILDAAPSAQSTSATLSASEFNAGAIVAFRVAAGSVPEWPGIGRLRLFLGATDADLPYLALVDHRGLEYVPAKFVGARVYRSLALSHSSTGNFQMMPFNVETHDEYGMFDPNAADGRLVVPTGLDGYWEFGGHLQFQASQSGIRAIVIAKNTTISLAQDNQSNLGGTHHAGVGALSGPVKMVAGDFVTVTGYQDSGGNLPYAVAGLGAGHLCYAWARFLGR
jgi:hypothetical protein